MKQEAKVVLIGWKKENDTLLDGTENVETLPPTSDVEMLAEYYSMADVFVIPSLAENYATTVIEAMACGTPVVGFASGGIPEQLAGKRGIAVEPGNQEAFDAAVSRGLEDGAELLRGHTLAEVIRRENSIERMTEEYKELYRMLAGT